MSIETTELVDNVMRRWPMTIRVFLDHRMRCVGCPIACFHTIDDACREHGVDRVKFMADLQRVIARDTGNSQVACDVVTARWPATR
ncbi:MAG TPA: DUF1858 domain-containing protein [Microvirga sp.]|nr:DUF1858 domain-containing protein [Microvirga sp.]